MRKTALVERCKNGEPEAYNMLYEMYAAKALRTAYLLTGNKALAEDIMQEAFIQCFQKIGSLKKTEAFEAWFYQILTRLSFRMGHKESRKRQIDAWEDQLNEMEAAITSEPLEVLQTSETRHEVRHALKHLSLPIRTVVVLHYFNEMSIKEIAEVLDCFEGTVKSRLHNGRKQLRQLLEKDIASNQNREEYKLNVNTRSV